MKTVKDIWNKVYENMKRNTYRPDETETQIKKSETTRIINEIRSKKVASENTRPNHQSAERSEIH